LSKILDDLLENLLQDLLEHLPGICDFIHYLAEHFEAQEHVENHLGVVCEDFILLNHFLIHSLVKNSFL